MYGGDRSRSKRKRTLRTTQSFGQRKRLAANTEGEAGIQKIEKISRSRLLRNKRHVESFSPESNPLAPPPWRAKSYRIKRRKLLHAIFQRNRVLKPKPPPTPKHRIDLDLVNSSSDESESSGPPPLRALRSRGLPPPPKKIEREPTPEPPKPPNPQRRRRRRRKRKVKKGRKNPKDDLGIALTRSRRAKKHRLIDPHFVNLELFGGKRVFADQFSDETLNWVLRCTAEGRDPGEYSRSSSATWTTEAESDFYDGPPPPPESHLLGVESEVDEQTEEVRWIARHPKTKSVIGTFEDPVKAALEYDTKCRRLKITPINFPAKGPKVVILLIAHEGVAQADLWERWNTYPDIVQFAVAAGPKTRLKYGKKFSEKYRVDKWRKTAWGRLSIVTCAQLAMQDISRRYPNVQRLYLVSGTEVPVVSCAELINRKDESQLQLTKIPSSHEMCKTIPEVAPASWYRSHFAICLGREHLLAVCEANIKEMFAASDKVWQFIGAPDEFVWATLLTHLWKKKRRKFRDEIMDYICTEFESAHVMDTSPVFWTGLDSKRSYRKVNFSRTRQSKPHETTLREYLTRKLENGWSEGVLFFRKIGPKVDFPSAGEPLFYWDIVNWENGALCPRKGERRALSEPRKSSRARKPRTDFAPILR